MGADWGYDEINLNVGCPSDRVQNGQFGACLMARPERVAEGVAAMRNAVQLPVTVKHRIGIDDLDRYEDMAHFVDVVSKTGCDRFTVHARKAWLKGLSPKENRNIPPLRYAEVHRLKREFPELCIEINGGITDLTTLDEQLTQVDAVMLGRAAYDNPYLFSSVDQRFFSDPSPPRTRREIVEEMVPYVTQWTRDTMRPYAIIRHMLQLFAGQPGARAWRRYLSENGPRPDANAKVLLQALAAQENHLDRRSTASSPA
jgi:tRNA-dihydrouridine synthase A